MSNPNQTPCPFCGKVHHGSDELAHMLEEMPSPLRDLLGMGDDDEDSIFDPFGMGTSSLRRSLAGLSGMRGVIGSRPTEVHEMHVHPETGQVKVRRRGRKTVVVPIGIIHPHVIARLQEAFSLQKQLADNRHHLEELDVVIRDLKGQIAYDEVKLAHAMRRRWPNYASFEAEVVDEGGPSVAQILVQQAARDPRRVRTRPLQSKPGPGGQEERSGGEGD